MTGTRSARPWVALGMAALMMTAGCATDEDVAVSATTAPITFTGHSPEEISRPPAEGKGIAHAQPAAPAPAGYVEEEFFVGGTATSFEAVDTPMDGRWIAKPADEAAYRTRVVVHRPADPAAFSGTVVVEWYNVSAIESAPDWAFLSQQIGREGDAYIGVSAQAQGIEGGDTLLNVEVDAGAAADAGVSADKSGLKNVDAERYGSLVHPGDAYAYDIFDQVGRAAAASQGDLLGGLQPKQVIAIGESQSAFFLSTLVNAVHPLDPVFDGFLIHSRGATNAPLDGDVAATREGKKRAETFGDATLIRTDLDVPVLLFETETDLTLLGYSHARQPDTDLIRTWEVAGTAHADAHTLRSLLGGPRDPSTGSLLGCTGLINAGPQHEVIQAALDHLGEWTAGGPPPPTGERLTVIAGDQDDQAEIERAEDGIAKGGVRNPLVDVPTAAYTGEPPAGTTIDDVEDDICVLFGTTVPFDQAALLERYGTPAAYLEAFRASAAEAVAAGFLLQGDADELIAEAQTNTALFG